MQKLTTCHFFYVALSYGCAGMSMLAMAGYVYWQSLKTKQQLKQWFANESNTKK